MFEKKDIAWYMRKRSIEGKINVKKVQAQNEMKHTKDRERREIESVHPLGYCCCSNNSLAAAEAPVGLQPCRHTRPSCNNWQSCCAAW